MPDTNRTRRSVTAEWRPHPARNERIASAKAAINVVLTKMPASVLPTHQRRLLSTLIWNITEADGKWGCRYRTKGVYSRQERAIRHEHVYSRKYLIDRLLRAPHNYEVILRRAIACVVTAEEDVKLAAVDPRLKGWHRYAAAGLVVIDGKTGEPKRLPVPKT